MNMVKGYTSSTRALLGLLTVLFLVGFADATRLLSYHATDLNRRMLQANEESESGSSIYGTGSPGSGSSIYGTGSPGSGSLGSGSSGSGSLGSGSSGSGSSGSGSSGSESGTAQPTVVDWGNSDFGSSSDIGTITATSTTQSTGGGASSTIQPSSGGGKICQDVAGWYDSDGPNYSCDWYKRGGYCHVFGNSYRNFGKTAQEACCACKHRRRELSPKNEDIPKQGFYYTGTVLTGLSRTMSKSHIVAIDMILSVDVKATEDNCKEIKWWDFVDNKPRLVCPNGAIGTLERNGLTKDVVNFSVEKGYCCHVPVTSDCVWKSVTKKAKEELADTACGAHSVLTGFEMSSTGIEFKDIQAIQCCRVEQPRK